MEKKIFAWEPVFFLFFGLFHLHRIWGLIDRKTYADFWLGILENRGVFYFILMGLLAILCIAGVITFFRNRSSNYWWRWIYLFGGSYVLFDLFAIAVGLDFFMTYTKIANDLKISSSLGFDAAISFPIQTRNLREVQKIPI